MAVAVLGFGAMGRARNVSYPNVAKFYGDSPIDPVIKQAFVLPHEADAAKKLGWDVNLDLMDAIQNDKTEYVDICLPNALHYSTALAAFEAKKHVFCEKPLAVSVDEAREMTEAAEANPGLLNSVNFIYRRVPANVFARQIVQENWFGELLEARSYYNQSWGGPNTGGGWRFDAKEGGGTLADLGSHAIDMLYFVTGMRPTEVVAAQVTHVKERMFNVVKEDGSRSREPRKIDVDDGTRIVYNLPNGGIGSLECTRNAWGTENTQGYEFYFENGAIRWCYDDVNYLDVYDPSQRGRGWRRVLCNQGGFAYSHFSGGHMDGYLDFLANACYENMRGIEGMDPIAPIATFRDAYEVERTVEAIRRSHRERRWVELDEIK
jgi:predicted dehydrogenase